MTTPPVYLDHAATTPVRPEVAAAFAEAALELGNPSSLHARGRAARRVVEESRESIAADLGAHPTEVIFTAGGSEADNLAVKGAWFATTEARPEATGVAISAVEHHAVLDAAHWLAEREGAHLTVLAVGPDGVIRLDEVAHLLQVAGPRTAVISVMWANNEVGSIQPVAEVAALAAAHGVPVHSDAVQAVGHVPIDFAASGLAALALSGHKLGAPIGVGALLARRDLTMTPVLHGGGQERGVRSGTVNTPGIRALAVAVRAAVADLTEETARLTALRDRLVAGVLEAVPGATLRGTPSGERRLPGNAHFTIEGTDADALLFGLDMVGVCASSGSACQAGVQQPSHVLAAMGDDDERARSAVRLTLGHTSTDSDVDTLLAVLPDVVERARAAHAPRRTPTAAPTAAATGTMTGGSR
ncbi:cysteine desulfurase family protein [Occultella kanbiaonis]|uniref:cysteine desulfurase family protein n=1 Tax=Occultella kanbiaonis TaxID=2675754 RepID=UPI0012B7D1FD|nr:cysteine desulfurase family protein [Occultella kanbiaonis]